MHIHTLCRLENIYCNYYLQWIWYECNEYNRSWWTITRSMKLTLCMWPWVIGKLNVINFDRYRANIGPMSSSVERQLQCIHFPQTSKLVHWIHSFPRTPSTMSSSYAPKLTAHWLEDISADCDPLSVALSCCLPLLVSFSLLESCFCQSSAFLFFSASLCSALH